MSATQHDDGRDGARLEPADRALLSRLLPDVGPEDLAVRQGQFHQVVIAPDRVVCLPRTAAAAARLPRRAAVLRVLAGLDLGCGTPEPLREGTDFLVLSRIPGAPLEADALGDPEVAAAVAAQYVTLLSGLARAGADEKVRAALPAPRGRWRRFAADVRAELFPLMSGGGRHRAGRELAALDDLPDLADAVVHGDLGAENVLWVRDGGTPRLSGVIDWDEVTIGDPAEDLAAIGASYGQGFLDRVLASRPDPSVAARIAMLTDRPDPSVAARIAMLTDRPDPSVAARIAAIRGTFALQQALSARRDGDEEELADGLAGYR